MLVLCGAPLGNPADASARLREVLGTADIVAAEDTRRLTHLGIPIAGKVVSYFDGNEEQRTPSLIDAMREGATVALITDGGMPSISDPGFRLVTAAIEAGLPVTLVPGPSAVTTALALSGLPCDRFCFEGFLPRKASARKTHLQSLANEPRTMVFFEATHRIKETLADMADVFGADRRAAVCRELTKTYEEVRRGPLAELAEVGEFRGEITLVVAGAIPARPTDESLKAEIASLVAGGMSKRDAASTVAATHNLPKREIYQLTLDLT